MPVLPDSSVIFAGGHDVEMREILKLVASFRPEIQVVDDGLSWGAKASDYATRIQQSLDDCRCVVMIELTLDEDWPFTTQFTQWQPGVVLVIDHHNRFGGIDAPTSLDQICSLLPVDRSGLSSAQRRRLDLVSANDRGHIEGMLQLSPPATSDEVRSIRSEEREIQGISREEESQSLAAIQSRTIECAGLLTVVSHKLRSSVAITDLIHEFLGGPGYENLLVIGEHKTEFFGARRVVECLAAMFPPPRSWSGGAMPDHAFWGSSSVLPGSVYEAVSDLLRKHIESSPNRHA